MRKAIYILCATLAASGTASARESVSNTWSGPYVGVMAARSIGSGSISDPTKYAFFDDDDGYVKLNPKGNYFGIEAGMNWQYGSAVFGLEADHSFGSASVTSNNSYPGTLKWDDITTARARIGYAHGATMLYLTAGAASTELNNKVFYDPIPCGGTGTVCNKKNKIGSALGFGAEAKLFPKTSLKLEYNRIKFKSLTLSNNDGAFYTFRNSSDFIKLGINYHF